MFNSKKNFVPIKEGSSVIFYVNTAGFPLSHETYAQMWTFAKQLYPEASDAINELQHNTDNHFETPCHTPPYNQITNHKLSNQEKVEKIQEYINKLQYNHTGMQFFDIRKERPLTGLMDIARKIIDECLPIKCLEAVILSIYLTNEVNTLEKFSLSFKTVSNKKTYRHVVLGIFCHKTGKYGTLGISRRTDLSYKPLKYDTLVELLNDFIQTYSKYLHRVKRIRIGAPVPNTNVTRSYEQVDWNGLTVYPNSADGTEWTRAVERYSRSIRLYNSFYTQPSNLNKFSSEVNLSAGHSLKQQGYQKNDAINKSCDLQRELSTHANKAAVALETVTLIDKPPKAGARSIRV